MIVCYKTYHSVFCHDVKGNYDQLDCRDVKDVYKESLAQINQRTSTYFGKGQTRRWLHLREQARQIVNRVSIEPQAGCELLWNPYDRRDYDLEQSRELVELYIRQGNFHKAEFLLEDIVLHFRDHLEDSQSWCLSKLIVLYTLAVDRMKAMPIKSIDKRFSASLSTLERIARIDIDVLSHRVVDSHLINFQKEFDLGMAFYFAVNNGACNLACIVLDCGAQFGATFARSMARGTWSGHDVLHCVWKPLHIAVDRGPIDMVRLLVAQGADVDTTTPNNSADPGLRPLHIAVKKGRLAIVVYLLSQNANIEARCRQQKTPLIWAARRQDPEILQYLLDKGARVDQSDKFQIAALHHAAEARQPANLRLIIDSGADIMARDEYGRMALHLASSSGTIECIDILVDNGVDVDATDLDTRTALHRASWEGNSVAVEHLIGRGASLSAEGCRGTPLHEAAGGGYSDDPLATIKTLIRYGADVNRQLSVNGWSINGKTPLHMAARRGFYSGQPNLDILQALCSHGAQVNIKDNESKTALDYVRGNEAATALLMRYLPKAPLSHQGQSLAPTLGPQWA
ncbi:MAG: hypothetical protein Q9226_007740 [Calogaya cf. arnoldii]